VAGGDLGNRRRETAELKRRIIELKDEGLSFREIAAEVDRDVACVWRHYTREMEKIPQPAAEAHAARAEKRKEAQLRRIDMQREIHEAIIQQAHKTVTVSGKVLDVEDHGPVFQATDRLVKLDDQEAKLLGLNAKVQIEHGGDVTYRFIGADPADLV